MWSVFRDEQTSHTLRVSKNSMHANLPSVLLLFRKRQSRQPNVIGLPRSCDSILTSSRLRAEKSIFEGKGRAIDPERWETHSIIFCHMVLGISLILVLVKRSASFRNTHTSAPQGPQCTLARKEGKVLPRVLTACVYILLLRSIFAVASCCCALRLC